MDNNTTFILIMLIGAAFFAFIIWLAAKPN